MLLLLNVIAVIFIDSYRTILMDYGQGITEDDKIDLYTREDKITWFIFWIGEGNL